MPGAPGIPSVPGAPQQALGNNGEQGKLHLLKQTELNLKKQLQEEHAKIIKPKNEQRQQVRDEALKEQDAIKKEKEELLKEQQELKTKQNSTMADKTRLMDITLNKLKAIDDKIAELKKTIDDNKPLNNKYVIPTEDQTDKYKQIYNDLEYIQKQIEETQRQQPAVAQPLPGASGAPGIPSEPGPPIAPPIIGAPLVVPHIPVVAGEKPLPAVPVVKQAPVAQQNKQQAPQTTDLQKQITELKAMINEWIEQKKKNKTDLTNKLDNLRTRIGELESKISRRSQ